MKKIVYAIAALALIFTGCAKELDNSTKDNFSKVRLHVKVADQLTKVSADNDGRYHWQAGDKITVFNDAENSFEFSTEKGGSDIDFGTYDPTWTGNLGKYAMYPASDDHIVSGNEIVFNLPSSIAWAENSTNMPMLGKISGDVATFKAVGGVLKLVCYNIPSGAAKLWFVSSSSRITGDFEIADASVANPVIASESATDDVLEITFAYSSNKVFYIPLPTGEIDGFEVQFLDGSDNELFSKSTDASFTVGRNKMIIAPALDCTGVADALLTNEEILASTIKGSYGTGSISSASGTWNYSACTQTYTAISKTYIQIRNNATVSYLQLPSFSNDIASITLHNIANASNEAYTGTVYFRDIASNDADPIASATCDVDAREDFVLNIPSGNTTGYIMSSAPCRFYAVTVKFVNAGTFPSLTATDDDLEIAVGSLTATTTVSLSNPVDALGISCVVNEEAKPWLSASISGTTLTVTAAEANSTAADRNGTVTLKATGAANVVISVTQPTKMVANPTVTATAGDSKFTATWAGVPHATSYVAYLHTAPTATPAAGGTNISASISESAGTYSITDYAVTNDTHYYLYVKVNEVESNYEAVSEYAVADFTPAEAKGTLENPYLASEAYDYISTFGSGKGPDDPIYVKGYVSSASNPSSNYQTYYISDDGTTTKQFQAYRGKGISGANITDANRVYVGDYVVVCGTAINYSGTTPEFEASSQIVTNYHLDIDYDEVEWAWNETSAENFTVSINSTGDYKTFTHSESGMDWATVSVVENVITITPKDNNESLVDDRVGTVTIHHASDLLDDIVINCTQTKAPAHSITIDSKTSLTVDLNGDHTNSTVLDVVSAYSPWSVKTVTGDSAADGFEYSVNTSTNKLTITPKADNTTGSKREGIGTIVLTDSSNGDLCTITLNQATKASSYTITFKTDSGDGTGVTTSTACNTIVSAGASYLSGNVVTATYVYYNGSNGLKLGKSGGAGEIKMNLASSVTPTSIVISAKRYNTSKAVNLSVNGSDVQALNTSSSFSEYTFDITTEISYIQLNSSQYCWIESITVNY